MSLSNVKLFVFAELPAADPSNAGTIFVTTDTQQVFASDGVSLIETTGGSGATTLAALTDVNIAGSVTGSVLFTDDGVTYIDSQNILFDDATTTLLLGDQSLTDQGAYLNLQGGGLLSDGFGDFAASVYIRTPGSSLQVVDGAVGAIAVQARVTGDAVERYAVDGDGATHWGDGSGATDTTISRSGVSELTLPSNLVVGAILVQDGGGFIDVPTAPLQAGGLFSSDSSTGFSANVMAANGDFLSSLVSGDANPSFHVDARGKQEWGDGTGALDTSLSRTLAGRLAMQSGGIFQADSLYANAGITIFSDGSLDVSNGSNPLSNILFSGLSADASLRFIVNRSGLHRWGDGTASVDTNLYRDAADTLKTDDSFVVGTDLSVLGNTSLGNAVSDTIGLYGVGGVAQQSAIAAPSTPSILYSQAEAQSAVDAINSIRVALQNIGITA